jgi:lysophospholipase L1-like esterase
MTVRSTLVTTLAALAATSALFAVPVTTASAATSTSVYVALGDSYSSGEGACKPVTVTGCDYRPGTNTAKDQCHRSHNAYGPRVAAKLPHGWSFVFAACSGATTANVLTSGQFGEPAQIAELAAASSATRQVKLVTMTVGGNDAGFSDAVGRCVTAHDLFSASCRGKVPWAIPATTLRTRLTAVYAAVHAAAPHARLLVLGYPRLFSPTPTVACDLAPIDSKAFSKAEDVLNASVAAAVKLANAAAGTKFATFVDDGQVFKGHELCGVLPGKSYLNGLLITSSGVRAESFHPNRSGQSVLAARLQKALT